MVLEQAMEVVVSAGDAAWAEGAAGWLAALQVREHSSAVERCGPHVAIFPAMIRSSNGYLAVLQVRMTLTSTTCHAHCHVSRPQRHVLRPDLLSLPHLVCSRRLTTARRRSC